MMTLRRHLSLALCLALFCVVQWTYGSKLKKQQETTMMKFIKLLFYRLIYGFANMIGLGDAAEEFGDGMLAPADYRQEDAEDDYYDDNKNDDYYSNYGEY
ncbi:uncharacterized protein LOC132946409 [Metopolophium dirhodum]|uniref:uncharacterized protein LOC132946409 n=1 Tax=Metopolophium dirhodum TaxID=44670 RepID=UPI00298FD15B|nr:uncharacterized protein LOC132946409 [Metopolophium dirhodum]XP_060872385.1 uncharacterized protein LOC132946409 [Metopolophium dirhodum]